MRLKISRKNNKIQLPVVISKEGKWLVARVPLLGLATQGKTLKEAKENVAELINLYLENPHTPKPELKNLSNLDVTLTTVTVSVRKGVFTNAKASAAA